MLEVLNCCFVDGLCFGILVWKERVVVIFYLNFDFYVFDFYVCDKFGNLCLNGLVVLYIDYCVVCLNVLKFVDDNIGY